MTDTVAEGSVTQIVIGRSWEKAVSLGFEEKDRPFIQHCIRVFMNGDVDVATREFAMAFPSNPHRLTEIVNAGIVAKPAEPHPDPPVEEIDVVALTTPNHWGVTDVEAIMREYECLYCKAKPTFRCVTRSGRPSSYSHSNRYYSAHRDGKLPIAPPLEAYVRAKVVAEERREEPTPQLKDDTFWQGDTVWIVSAPGSTFAFRHEEDARKERNRHVAFNHDEVVMYPMPVPRDGMTLADMADWAADHGPIDWGERSEPPMGVNTLREVNRYIDNWMTVDKEPGWDTIRRVAFAMYQDAGGEDYPDFGSISDKEFYEPKARKWLMDTWRKYVAGNRPPNGDETDDLAARTGFHKIPAGPTKTEESKTTHEYWTDLYERARRGDPDAQMWVKSAPPEEQVDTRQPGYKFQFWVKLRAFNRQGIETDCYDVGPFVSAVQAHSWGMEQVGRLLPEFDVPDWWEDSDGLGWRYSTDDWAVTCVTGFSIDQYDVQDAETVDSYRCTTTVKPRILENWLSNAEPITADLHPQTGVRAAQTPSALA